MNINRLVCLFTFFATISMFAQLPTDYRSEQIFLAPRQYSVMPGDTIDIDGIVTCLSNDESRPYSHYIYIESINDEDSVVVRNKVSCDSYGRFFTSIPTDPLDSRGVLYIRAYTQLMRNFNPESFALQPIMIGRDLPSNDEIIDENTNLQAIPFGGVLKPGKSQHIAAFLTNGQGFPLTDRALHIIDNYGDTITTSITSLSGISTLTFFPNTDKSYRVVFREMGVEKSVALNVDRSDAPQLEGKINDKRIFFSIDGNIEKKRLIVYDRHNGVTEARLSHPQGSITLEHAPEIATLFLTDSNLEILTEITISNSCVKGELKVLIPDTMMPSGKTIDYSNIESDSVKLISIRVLESDNFLAGNVESSLLYISDYSSPFVFPHHYAGSESRTREKDLQAWLGTASFKRFNLSDVHAASDSATYSYLPELTMQIKGRIWRSPKQPFKKGQIVAYNEDNFCVYDTTISQDGFFALDVDDFYDGTKFFLQPINTKGKAEKAQVTIDDDVFPSPVINRQKIIGNSRYINADVSFDSKQSRTARELANVTVKARVKAEPVSTKQFYSQRFKNREEIERKSYLTLRDILEDMPFIVLKGTSPVYILSTRGASSLNSGSPMKVLMDGTVIDEQTLGILIDMPSNDIESVEQLSPAEALAYVPFGLSGAISITTRRLGHRKQNIVSKGTDVIPLGLTRDIENKNLKRGVMTVPDKPGKYRLSIDYIGSDGSVHSIERPFEVK